MNPAGWAFSVAAGLALSACAGAVPVPTVQAQADSRGLSVVSTGLLDRDAVAGILHHAAPGGRPVRLILSGPGGHYGPMMELIAFLRQRPDIPVVATGQCFSACAIVWASAPNREMTEDALLGFHGGSCQNGCLPGALSEQDRTVFAQIRQSAPLLAASLAVAKPHALARRGNDLVVYSAGNLAAMGIGRLLGG